jgi:crotonobetainyl-CoA:carnitine CoA-transferase CaiB-like acyl-CoA transferase
MLADMGADVIKIEPPAGDLTRFATPRRNGLASYFVQQNVGKRNLSLDLATPQGAEILLGLAEHADVLVENYRPGVMDRLGLGADTVRARNPSAVGRASPRPESRPLGSTLHTDARRPGRRRHQDRAAGG